MVHVGSTLVHAARNGSTLGPRWVHVGSTSGPLWDHARRAWGAKTPANGWDFGRGSNDGFPMEVQYVSVTPGPSPWPWRALEKVLEWLTNGSHVARHSGVSLNTHGRCTCQIPKASKGGEPLEGPQKVPRRSLDPRKSLASN